MHRDGRTLRNTALVLVVLGALFTGLTPQPVSAVGASAQTDLVGPPGSGEFGRSVTALPNGNIVVTDPYYDDGSTEDVGAVYLYDGTTRALISALVGATADDRVGYGGVTVLTNGNYVVRSPDWDNGDAADAGAATWGSGTVGVSGIVSSTNSLIGSSADDRVASTIVALTNGNYVVSSLNWDNGEADNVGAVTWGDGMTGISGVVSSTNSLVGSTAGDVVGSGSVTALSNGNYVVHSPNWHNGGVAAAGAVTWGDGTTGLSAAVSPDNSLVGGSVADRVGSQPVLELSNGNYVVHTVWWDNGAVSGAGAVTWGDGTSGVTGVISSTNSLVGDKDGDNVGYWMKALTNGNYVVISFNWDNGPVSDAGAVTWVDGTGAVTGVVSSTNSLVGSSPDDHVGYGNVTALSNGNYVVTTWGWDNGGEADVGAVTWRDGTTGATGVVSSTNSLVGSTTADRIGLRQVAALSNGNYVVASPYWDGPGAVDAGAVTWCDGTSGRSGVVAPGNSLVGSSADDRVGSEGVEVLTNGNYVVSSPSWDSAGKADVGAVTWCDGTTGLSGLVSSTNSLVGSTAGDGVGGVTPLTNGNYVVSSPYWDSGDKENVGAVTWADGMTALTGVVSLANSLAGSAPDDQVGYRYMDGPGVTALSDGNYVVRSRYWDSGEVADAGAVSWCDGTIGTSGVVSSTNSLVGSTAGDRVGWDNVTVLSHGDYVVRVRYWDNGETVDAGAVTWGNGTSGVRGAVTGANSVRGTTADGGHRLVYSYDDTNGQLVVGRPADNIVTFFKVKYRVYLPLVVR
jgi:uncharacterized protein YndB with AHSA1/START domain